jgi:hypothetical protein
MLINQRLLDQALRRYPWLLKQVRDSASFEILERYADGIIREYHLCQQEELKRDRLAQSVRRDRGRLDRPR